MSKGFKGASIDDLGYDFTKVLPEAIEDIGYTPGEHPIAEPSSVQIVAYFGAYGSLMRDNAVKTQNWQDRLDSIEPGTDEASRQAAADARAELTTQYEEWARTNAQTTLETRRHLLSELCSGDPSVALLECLPGRWLDAFESYMQDELTGKEMSGTSA